jgi:protein-tyrosine phosphatase
MKYIKNISRTELGKGNYQKDTFNKVLIQIENESKDFITVNGFEETYRFCFKDIEFRSQEPENQINTEQCADIIDILKDNQYNVLVQCTVGKSRSGTIVEFAVNNLNYQECDKERTPNPLILRCLNDTLEWIDNQ